MDYYVIASTKIFDFYGKIGHKTVKLGTESRKSEQSCILDQLSVSADISDPLLVIGILINSIWCITSHNITHL